MTQEQKKLLLKDLCARLPYDVKVKFYDHWVDEYEIIPLTAKLLSDTVYIGDIKPYLLPLSSVTEEQKKYISDRWGINEEFEFEIDPNWGEYFVDLCDTVDFIDWLNAHHFDYNYLIPKGLAIDATDKNIY